jgi:hypothetical protein
VKLLDDGIELRVLVPGHDGLPLIAVGVRLDRSVLNSGHNLYDRLDIRELWSNGNLDEEGVPTDWQLEWHSVLSSML